VVAEAGRVRFTHELLGRFLAAEALVFAATSGSELGDMLRSAHHVDLRRFAIALERDSERRADALAAVASADLYVACARGELGPEVAVDARAAIAGTLAEAASAIDVDMIQPHGPVAVVGDLPFPSWEGLRDWGAAECAQLAAAGEALHLGLF